MKIRFVDRDLVRRFGGSPIEISDEQAVSYLKAGRATTVVDYDNRPPIHEGLKTGSFTGQEKEESRAEGQGFPLIGWIHDTEHYGGAELSNTTVIEAGRKAGFDIYICNPATFNRKKLVRCDLLVISNFFLFEPKRANFVADLLYEYKKPYVKYEHDHREIIGDQARPKFARLLFGRSLLNIFISPIQMRSHREHLGGLIDPFFILPPAIDTKRFKILPHIKRDPNKVVNTTGRLKESKGLRHMLQFVMAKQEEYHFEIYTKYQNEVRETFKDFESIVDIFPPVENEYLPKVYNSAGYVAHLPQALEACGRTIAEGLLCGCKSIFNKNVGIRSFEDFGGRGIADKKLYFFTVGDEKKFNLTRFKEIVECGPFDFWRALEFAYNGFYEQSILWRKMQEALL